MTEPKIFHLDLVVTHDARQHLGYAYAPLGIRANFAWLESGGFPEVCQ